MPAKEQQFGILITYRAGISFMSLRNPRADKSLQISGTMFVYEG